MDLSVSDIRAYLNVALRPTKKLYEELSTCVIEEDTQAQLKQHVANAKDYLDKAAMIADGQGVGNKMPLTPQDHEQKQNPDTSQGM